MIKITYSNENEDGTKKEIVKQYDDRGIGLMIIKGVLITGVAVGTLKLIKFIKKKLS